MIDFTCTCGFKSQAKDELAGKKVKCPNCGRVVILPSPDVSSQHSPDEEYAMHNSEKKGRMKWYALIGGAIAIVVIGVVTLALNRDPFVANTKNRKESYKQYLQKSEAFFDSVRRTNSDLEVGINHPKFQERI